MKKRIFRFGWIAASLFIMTTVIAISCKKTPDSNVAVSNIEQVGQPVKTIPVSIEVEGQKARIGIALSAQWYTLDLSSEAGKQGAERIKEAVKNHTPVRLFIKDNTTEIERVDEATAAEKNHFSQLIEKSKEEIANSAASSRTAIIPSQTTMNNLFNTIRNNSCVTTTATPPANPCITFRYAVDGCYARAHKMVQILNANGYDCQKQFVYGNLRASTGSCCVRWGYHVAVLVLFRNASGVTEERIFDPSLFTAPVTAATWRAACNNAVCGGTGSIIGWVNTLSTVYYRDFNNTVVLTDPNYINTNCVLTTFRNLSGCTPSPAPNVSGCPGIL
jgi:hypothetical protein